MSEEKVVYDGGHNDYSDKECHTRRHFLMYLVIKYTEIALIIGKLAIRKDLR